MELMNEMIVKEYRHRIGGYANLGRSIRELGRAVFGEQYVTAYEVIAANLYGLDHNDKSFQDGTYQEWQAEVNKQFGILLSCGMGTDPDSVFAWFLSSYKLNKRDKAIVKSICGRLG